MAGTDGIEVGGTLAAARDLVAKTPFCFAATAAEEGVGVNVRLVGPIAGIAGDEDWTIWFSTLRGSRKAADIQRSGRLTLGYQHQPDLSYVALIGRAALFDDRSEIRRRWQESWRVYYPAGPDDPELVFVKMNVDRIELCIPGVSPEPFGSGYSVLERDADRGWKLVGG